MTMLRNWNGTFRLCTHELREKDTTTIVFDKLNEANSWIGVEGVIPELSLTGPMTKLQVLKAALAHANQHVKNMIYTKIDTRHCYGCEKVANYLEKVKKYLYS